MSIAYLTSPALSGDPFDDESNGRDVEYLVLSSPPQARAARRRLCAAAPPRRAVAPAISASSCNAVNAATNRLSSPLENDVLEDLAAVAVELHCVCSICAHRHCFTGRAPFYAAVLHVLQACFSDAPPGVAFQIDHATDLQVEDGPVRPAALTDFLSALTTAYERSFFRFFLFFSECTECDERRGAANALPTTPSRSETVLSHSLQTPLLTPLSTTPPSTAPSAAGELTPRCLLRWPECTPPPSGLSSVSRLTGSGCPSYT